MLLLASLTCRCPNPAACSHDHHFLAKHHPNSNNADLMTWANYSMQLCNHNEGYEGILCGVCSRGFGQTAPFKCNRCIGYGSSSAKAPQPGPGPAPISGLYFVYWLALTCWLLLCVRFSTVAPRVGPTQTPDRKPAVTAARAVLQECQVADAWKDTSDIAAGPPMIDTSGAPDQQQQQQQQSGTNGFGQATSAAAAQPKQQRTSKSLDITKVCCAVLSTVVLCCCAVFRRCQACFTSPAGAAAVAGSPFYVACRLIQAILKVVSVPCLAHLWRCCCRCRRRP
jgi:hypothetical protein